jgi:hypothetical protein
MAKKVLDGLSGHCYWGEELIGSLEAIDAAGYESEFVTPEGARSQTLPASMEEKHVGMEDRKSNIRNRRATGRCLEYDYKVGTGFLGTDFNMGPAPYPLDYFLGDATAPDGAHHGNFVHENSLCRYGW